MMLSTDEGSKSLITLLSIYLMNYVSHGYLQPRSYPKVHPYLDWRRIVHVRVLSVLVGQNN